MRRSSILASCIALSLPAGAVGGRVGAQDHHETVQSLVIDARAAQSKGDFPQAADAYREAVALDPSIPELWADLGLMDYESGNHLEAVKSFQQAARLKPSLFVPQLFLGIEDLEANRAEAALPWLENAVRLNPTDLEAVLSLARACEMLNEPGRAADSYLHATQISPRNGNAWLRLGTAYLEQVDNDARVMTSDYGNSAYVKLRAGETYADEGKLGPAQEEFEAALKTPPPIPCERADLGIIFLREGRDGEARTQFEMETKTASPCSLAALGNAVADIAQGNQELALQELTTIGGEDSGFLQSSLPLFQGTLTPAQASSFVAQARNEKVDGNASFPIASLFERMFVSGDLSIAASGFEDEKTVQVIRKPAESAERLSDSGHFVQCEEILTPALGRLTRTELGLLASCSFSAGDFRMAATAGERLKSYPAERVEGLYWESKADQKLAIAALARAGEIDPDSAGVHVLLGNAFRQQRHWSEAEAEYRTALSLDPANRAARLSLGIVLFTELKNDEALEIDKSLLAETPEDPEANLLAAEILAEEHRFRDAEPYLSNCRKVKPELVPQVHILLGQVYAETSRISEAIAEYKLGITMDEDGSLHYQLARLYQKTGNARAAAEEMQLSRQIREKWDNQAHLDLGQPLAATSPK